MAFLTIDATAWDVQVAGAQSSLVRVGAVARAFDGTLRSFRRDQFLETHGWQTAPLTPADAATFVALDDGALHAVSGDVFGGASLSALVDITNTQYVPEGDTGFRIVYVFALRCT